MHRERFPWAGSLRYNFFLTLPGRFGLAFAVLVHTFNAIHVHVAGEYILADESLALYLSVYLLSVWAYCKISGCL